ncbi:TrbI/VirB10 family protein [Paraburkholderia sp. DD10]|jgi:type IV secretion system protein TrbI|uniref:Type IV secretion system protein VirB10 n=1 Tax=Paraburkholderia terricola TaxID=169427 RepID=A0A1M6VMV9_9BURK|nr:MULTISPECIES: TrbI/VirB10 family protein [Paraburkholderia]ORC45773.1 conjugal transfer protein TrbI [Burkholderia sp. A27]SDP08173.1 type IV secretion system protein VirB10 [Paraburkholderia sediminicola]SHK82661.1 type IV secretion system protein VirB10 [Paraburkholderia terricola]
MAAPENSGHSSSPLTPNPERLTRVRRDLAKILLVALGSALVAIVLVHALSHPHETAAERRAREQLDAEARQPRASPDALRKRLEDQRNLAMARAGRETASAPLGGTPLDGIPKGVPGDDAAPLPPRDHASGQSSANRDADRLALQRQIEAMQSQSLVAYEDTTRDTRGASGQTSNVQDPNRIAGSLPNLPETAPEAATTANGAPGTASPPLQQAGVASAIDRRNADWLNQQGNEADDEKPLVPVPLKSPYMVLGGTPVPTVILQGAKSDMPGSFRAMVDRDIYDSIDGRCKLIPKGTRILGRTNNDVAIGQDLMLMAATRMTFRHATMRLDGLTGNDPDGEAGVSADVDNHFFRIFGSTFLIAGVAAWIGHNQSQSNGTTINVNGGVATDLSSAAAQSLSQTTQTILQRNMNIQPTLRLEPGQRITFITQRDMMLPPGVTDGICHR